MESRHEDLLSYKPDHSVGDGLHVFLMVKGFNQKDIVAKIIERQGQRAYGLTAAHDPADRRYGVGHIVGTYLDAPAFNAATIADSEHTVTCLEPFSVAFRGACIACTNGSEVQIINIYTGAQLPLSHPWLAFAHTLEYSADGERLLVSSAGFDTLLEFGVGTGEVTWEWNAWDHGVTEVSLDGSHMTRSPRRAAELRDAGSSVTLVEHPGLWPAEGIPTHRAPGRLNGAAYDGDSRMLITFYHRPELAVVGRGGELMSIDHGLVHPHGFILGCQHGSDYIVTNSGAGELIGLDATFGIVRTLSFGNMPADPLKARVFGEWIQSVTVLDYEHEIVAAVDALRNGVHIIDLRKRRRRFVSNPPEWHLHAVIRIPEDFDLPGAFAHSLLKGDDRTSLDDINTKRR
jgi:hypothetical protein